ncbi:MAG: hypothetical protein QW197_00345 [Candidatus Aenigmatarchaeota archaeon]
MKLISSIFLNLILATLIAISTILIIYFTQFYQTKYVEELERIRFNQQVYDLAKKLANCLGFEYEKTYYLDYKKIEEFSKIYNDIEPRCAIAKDFDYNVKIIQFEKEVRNYPIQIGGGCGWAWVVNSGSGGMHSSISLVTSEGSELRRHYTHPNKAGNPSRTAVDIEGNVWVGNRADGTLVKITFDKNKCKGATSEDKDGNGKIDYNEMLDFSSDGCIEIKLDLKCSYVGVRAVCIDNESKYVYAGCYNDRKLFKISNKDGSIEKVWNLPATPYGCVVGNDGNVWISTASSILIKLNPNTDEIKTFSVPFIYGIWRCYNLDCVVFSEWTLNRIALFNTTSEKIIWERSSGINTRGVFVDENNYIYAVGSSSNDIYKYDINGNLIKVAKTCGIPTGVAQDACGYLWVQCMDGYVYIFDKDLNLINFFSISGIHYTYSDFTGFLSNAKVSVPLKIEEKILKVERKEFSFGMLEKELAGIRSFGPKINLQTSISIPILIKYNETFIVEGLMIINAYKGFLEEFYSFLDDICSKDFDNFEITKQFYFDYNVKILKENDYYKICSENVCKKLVCKYEIEEKEFDKGDNVINVRVSERKLIIS